MRKLSEWIVANAITMTAKRAADNPNMEHMPGEQPMWHWRCELSRAGRTLTIPFSCGLACAEHYKQFARTVLDEKWNTTERGRLDENEARRLQIGNPRTFGVIPTPPTASDVLDCLASDAAGYDNAAGFEDWAREYGYDTDSRTAEKTYNVIGTQAGKLRRFLGNVLYEELLYGTERL